MTWSISPTTRRPAWNSTLRAVRPHPIPLTVVVYGWLATQQNCLQCNDHRAHGLKSSRACWGYQGSTKQCTDHVNFPCKATMLHPNLNFTKRNSSRWWCVATRGKILDSTDQTSNQACVLQVVHLVRGAMPRQMGRPATSYAWSPWDRVTSQQIPPVFQSALATLQIRQFDGNLTTVSSSSSCAISSISTSTSFHNDVRLK